MKPKQIVKITTDLLMTLGLLFLMGYQFWGDSAHEWVGAGMFALFILHHILNLNWWKRLFCAPYTALRTLTLLIDLLTLCAMLGLMLSGIILSQRVFAFLPIEGGAAFARLLHMVAAYWGFVLMALHLGLHWGMLLAMGRKAAKLRPPSRLRAGLLNGAGIAAAAYGLYAFIKRDMLTYMFLQTHFVFLDFSESKLAFYIDYLAIMALFIFISHWASKLLRLKGHNGRRLELNNITQ